MRRVKLFALFSVLIFFLRTGPALGQTLRGTLEKRSFTGPVTGRQIEFSIYLPENYSSSGERYPVIYHLHGLGGSHDGYHTRTVPASFEKARDMGIIGPVIIVFPDGYKDSFWADSFDRTKPAETNIIAELIPYVDENFRTLRDARFRVIQGFSMGGFGAAKFITKFPDLFNLGIIYDGALLDWRTLVMSHTMIAFSIFANSEDYFNQFSPWFWAGKNKNKLTARTRLRLVVGALLPWNRNFLSYLSEIGIPVEYIETSCLHDLNCLLHYEGLGSAAFISEALNQAFRDYHRDDKRSELKKK
jgi:endo-1,4-beta-xylanase